MKPIFPIDVVVHYNRPTRQAASYAGHGGLNRRSIDQKQLSRTALALRQADQARTDFAATKIRSPGHPKAGFATADAPGASEDRVRHHIRDDDADDGEVAVPSALVREDLRPGTCAGRQRVMGSRHPVRRTGSPPNWCSRQAEFHHILSRRSPGGTGLAR